MPHLCFDPEARGNTSECWLLDDFQYGGFCAIFLWQLGPVQSMVSFVMAVV